MSQSQIVACWVSGDNISSGAEQMETYDQYKVHGKGLVSIK